MIKAAVLRPGELDDADVRRWRALCAAEPAFRNPLLGPDFARLAGEVRGDARVAVFRRGADPIGYLAFHKRPGGFADPIGSAFSDYQALISAPGERIDGPEALAAAGVGAMRFTALVDPHGVFAQTAAGGCEGFVIELDGPAGAFDEALKAANPRRHRNWRRLQHKLEREWGEIAFTPGSASQDDLDQLVAWKRDQFHRTGLHDVLRPAWAQRLYRAAMQRRSGELRGILTTLHAGGRLVAGHFGVAVDGVFHTWLSAMHPDCAACGPGQVLMLQVPELMQAEDLKVYDLGPGYPHYKAPFSTGTVAVREGAVLAAGRASLAARSIDGAWSLAGARRIEAVGRLRRRLDQIASAETSLGGCVRGMVEAVASLGRRAASREHERDQAVRLEA